MFGIIFKWCLFEWDLCIMFMVFNDVVFFNYVLVEGWVMVDKIDLKECIWMVFENIKESGF